MIMPFQQAPPALGNQYEDDSVLRSYLRRTIPAEVLREIEPALVEMGRLAGGELYQMQLADRLNEPTLTQWDAWGNRIDRIELTPLWRVAERIAAEHGVVATAYEQKHGRFSRVHQCALAYLFTPSTDIYSCPLAMSDGAARTLLDSGNQALIERAVPHLTSRDPKAFWTSGQWMTELTGGSDVGASETIAKPDLTRNSNSETANWLLYGRKWFTSAATSQIALTLARPEGNPPGGRGLALFYLEMRDEHGRLHNISIDRLKDKLGTRKVPTAELTLDGTPAQLVLGTTDGVRNIAPLLNITRLWNGISAVSLMRRSIALALDYSQKRSVFGAPLSEKPLHMDTLAGLQAEAEAAFHLAFMVAELTGRAETAEIVEEQSLLLRLLTPLMKLTTARQVVAVISEALEAFGGAGYVEDTGLPMLLRDAQVLPIWEGTTNVLALDALRALGADDRTFTALKLSLTRCLASVNDKRLAEPVRIVRAALAHAESWLAEARQAGTPALEAGARRFALTLGRATELALLCSHAQWSRESENETGSTDAARRFGASGIDLIAASDL
ncbi:MAG: acyl-CoA dehydrogenase [Pyrinomonadaceae bacterium]|jgi:alkylation response protein AidB-like acyl-CoA dehydrogenase|nr:acyl-CoA dehydrogenase [Pyrinomonadaceae bacterium]